MYAVCMGISRLNPPDVVFFFFFSIEDKIFLTSFYVFVYSPHSVPYIAYYLRSKTFAVLCLNLHSQKTFAVTSFYKLSQYSHAKIRQKTFAVVKQSAKNMRVFITNNKQYMVLTLLHSYWYKKLENNNCCYWVVSHIPTFNINGTIYWLDPKTAHAMEPC